MANTKNTVFKSFSPRRKFMKREEYAKIVREKPEEVDNFYKDGKQLYRELCANCGKSFGQHYGERAGCNKA